MRFFWRSWWRIRRFWREMAWEPSGTDLDAQPEHCDAIREERRRAWVRRRVAKGVRRGRGER